MRLNSLFRWTPAAIILWFFGVLFAVFGILNIWLARLSSRGALPNSGGGASSKMTQLLLHGAAQNGVIAVLCILSWYFMRRRTSISLPAGALALTVALFIIVRRWVYLEMAGTNHLPWAEPLLIWPFLLYAIFYGYVESKGCVAS
jgi:hypothetical protein